MRNRLLYIAILLVLYGCARVQRLSPPSLIPPPPEVKVEKVEKEPPKEHVILEEEKVFEVRFEGEVEIEEKAELAPKEEVSRPLPIPKEKTPTKIKVTKKEEKKRDLPFLQDALRPGENLLFGIKYLGLRVGEGILRTEKMKEQEGYSCYHFVSIARSTGIFALLYRVNERLDSFMDAVHLHSIRFEQRSYARDKEPFILVYDQKRHIVHLIGKGETYKIPPNTQDPLSAFYFLRIKPLQPGDKVIIPVSTGKNHYFIEAEVVRKEKVEVGGGSFQCLVIKASYKGKKSGERLTIYLSDDERRVPVLIKSHLSFGTVVMILEEMVG